MPRTRILNEEEKCELISALANARVNNNKKAKTFKGAAQDAATAEKLTAALKVFGGSL